MDKISKEKKYSTPESIRLKLNEQPSIDGSTYYRANVQHRRTVDIGGLADRIVANRTEYQRSTLISIFQFFKEEIYDALQNGDCVDLGFGMLSLRVQGKFENLVDSFDPRRHAFHVVFTPSARMQQVEQSLKVNNQATELVARYPQIHEVNSDHPIRRPAHYVHKQVRAGSHVLYITGKNISIMGDHPDTGIRFRSADKVVEVPFQYIVENKRTLLSVYMPEPLEVGRWKLELATQFNTSYRLYKEPRKVTYTFDVVAETTSF